MDKLEKETIKKIEFERKDITIRETYIDENGHERDREKIIKMPVFDKIEKKDIAIIAESICKEIETLNVETEFTIQQFINKYEVEDRDKFSLCNLVLDYCKNNNIFIIEKRTGEVVGLPWNIPRIKKN